MVIIGPKLWVQNNTQYENGQNSPKQPGANNLIFEYIQIFWTNIFICKKILTFLIGQIYLDIHLWFSYHAKYIRIFIGPIYMVTNRHRHRGAALYVSWSD